MAGEGIRSGGAPGLGWMGRVVPVLVLVGLAISAVGCNAQTPPGEVTFYGDSLTVQSMRELEALTGGAPYGIATRAISGTALCDWIHQMRSDAADPAHPRVVVVAFSGNRATACMKDADGEPLEGQAALDKYAADLQEVHDIWSPLGVPVSILGAPAMVDDSRRDLDTMLRRKAALLGFYYEDTTWDLSPGNRFVDVMPCADWETTTATCTGPVVDGVAMNVVRQPDGMHFCPTGVVDEHEICDVYSSGAARWARHLHNAAEVGVEQLPAETTTTAPGTTVPETTAPDTLLPPVTP